MPIETQTRELLHRAGDQIDVGPPPIDALLGAPARRRRRLVTVTAGLAAAAVVVGVVWINDSDPTPEPADSTPPATTGPLVATPGTRLVGAGQVAVEVPDTWGTDQIQCYIPIADTVTFGTDVTISCMQPLGEFSALHVSTTSDPTVRDYLDAAVPADPIGGVEALATGVLPIPCPTEDGSDSCVPNFVAALITPETETALWVTSPNRNVVTAILDSVRAIPDGFVAIPDDATAAELEGLGLEVTEVEKQTRPLTYSTDPPAGSLVAVGSAVTVSVPSGATGSESGVSITGAEPACAPTDEPAMKVTVETTRRYDVHVVLAIGRDVIGKLPTLLMPGQPNHVIVPVYQRANAPEVTVQVFGLGMRMSESLLAEQDHVPLHPAPLCG